MRHLHLAPFVLLAACAAPDDPADRPPASTTPSDTAVDPPPVETGTTVTTGATGDTGGTTADTGTDACAVPPPVPASYTTLPLPTAMDFDFDGDGYLCTVVDRGIGCIDQLGATKVVAEDLVPDEWAGLRVLADGDWVFTDADAGTVVRLDIATGDRQVIFAGFEIAYALEVDADDHVFVVDRGVGRVHQIDADTGDHWPVADGITDGIAPVLSPDGQTLYVSALTSGIYAIDRLGPTTWDDERFLYDPPGIWGFDGINVDSCGNIYAGQYDTGRVIRIGPDGQDPVLVADLPSFWLPNMHWGNGIGGWETDVLYVTNFFHVFALEVGIEGKAQVVSP